MKISDETEALQQKLINREYKDFDGHTVQLPDRMEAIAPPGGTLFVNGVDKGGRCMVHKDDVIDLHMATPVAAKEPESLDGITSIEIEAQSASIMRVTAERLFAGTHAGKIKLVVGKESVVLNSIQAATLGQKLLALSQPSGKTWTDKTE